MAQPRRTYDALTRSAPVTPLGGAGDVYEPGRTPPVNRGVVEAFSAAYSAFEPISKQLQENAEKKQTGQAQAFFVEHEEILQELLGAKSDYEQNQILNIAAERGLVDASLIPHLRAHSVNLQLSRSASKLDAELSQAIINEQQVAGHEDPDTGEWVPGKTFEQIWDEKYPKFAATWAPRTELGAGAWSARTEELRTKHQKSALSIANSAQKDWGKVNFKEDIQQTLFKMAEDSPLDAPAWMASLKEILDTHGRNGQDPNWKQNAAQTMAVFLQTYSHTDPDGAQNVLSILQNMEIDGRRLGDGAQEPIFSTALAVADENMLDSDERMLEKAKTHDAVITKQAVDRFNEALAEKQLNDPGSREELLSYMAQGDVYSAALTGLSARDQGHYIRTWMAQMSQLVSAPEIDDRMRLVNDQASITSTKSVEELDAYLERSGTEGYTPTMLAARHETEMAKRKELEVTTGNSAASAVTGNFAKLHGQVMDLYSNITVADRDNIQAYLNSEEALGLDRFIEGGVFQSNASVEYNARISKETNRLISEAKDRGLKLEGELRAQWWEVSGDAARESIRDAGLTDGATEHLLGEYKQWRIENQGRRVDSVTSDVYRNLAMWQQQAGQEAMGSPDQELTDIYAQAQLFRTDWDDFARQTLQEFSPAEARPRIEARVRADIESLLPPNYKLTPAYKIAEKHPELHAAKAPVSYEALTTAEKTAFTQPGAQSAFSSIAGVYAGRQKNAEDVDIVRRMLVHGAQWAKYSPEWSFSDPLGGRNARATQWLRPSEAKDYFTLEEGTKVDITWTPQSASVFASRLGLLTINDLEQGSISVPRGNRSSASHRKQAEELGIMVIGGDTVKGQAGGAIELDLTVIDPRSTPLFNWGTDESVLRQNLADHEELFLHWGRERGFIDMESDEEQEKAYLKQVFQAHKEMGSARSNWHK